MSKNKHKRRIFLSGLCAIVISFSPVLSLPLESFAVCRELNVTRVQQTKTNWCWAACSQMFGKWEIGAKGKTQSQIVTFIKGSSSVNLTANDAEVQLAMNYSIGCADVTPSKTTYTATKSWRWHISRISTLKVTVAKFSWTNGGGHTVIVNGYDDVESTLLLTDPASGCSSKSFNYALLVNGCKIQSGTGKYVKSFYKV